LAGVYVESRSRTLLLLFGSAFGVVILADILLPVVPALIIGPLALAAAWIACVWLGRRAKRSATA
jgi:hypothetical protein